MQGNKPGKVGRPGIGKHLRELIIRIATENAQWGYRRIVPGWPPQGLLPQGCVMLLQRPTPFGSPNIPLTNSSIGVQSPR